jgi:hypothetical protein
VGSLGTHLRQQLGRIRPLVQIPQQSDPPRAQLEQDQQHQLRDHQDQADCHREHTHDPPEPAISMQWAARWYLPVGM